MEDIADDEPVRAGSFADWLVGMQRALRGEVDSRVPCNGCTACCRSSQFVHIGPDERATLAHIPAALLFPAPGLAAGHVVLGYDEHGHCPMLVDGACSIYAHRPRACRTYDCRVFPATGVEVDADKPAIADRARRWEFDFSRDVDLTMYETVQAAARSVADRPGDAPLNATQHAVWAIMLLDQERAADPS